jgi:hypothetical protein
MLWVGMSRGQFVGGRNVKAPTELVGTAIDQSEKGLFHDK